MEQKDNERLRKYTHFFIALIFVVFILLFRIINSTSVLDAIYTLCSYTYGPLLGLFTYGIFTHRGVSDNLVPYIAIASPVICGIIDYATRYLTGYQFGYELLLLNGAITFLGLWLSAPTNRYHNFQLKITDENDRPIGF